nr:MAG: ParB-like nuclease domain [Bacteriophage sp.]
MKITVKKLSELHKPAHNIRRHSEKQLTEYIRSIEMFGQVKPLVVAEDGEIIAGNGLYEALLRMGRETCDCYVMVGLTDVQKKKLMMADNKVYELGFTDVDAIEELVKELDGDVDVPGREPLLSLLGGKVPVVVVDHHGDESADVYGTITHNRARGTHLLEPMKAIVKKLIDEGKTVEEIGKQLGMKPEEIFRLSGFTKDEFLNMMTKGHDTYSKAQVIRSI